jgi:site-specific DNA-methyltransferase (adenine-specific)
VIALGNGQIALGDCLDVMRSVPAGSVDMILCDLPYGTTACSWDSVIPFGPLWSEYWRIAKPNAAVVLTASQPFTSALVMSQIDRFKYEWIWKKNAGSNFGTVKFQPMKEHENICVFGINKLIYNPIMQERSEVGKKMRAGKPIIQNKKEKPSDFVSDGQLNKGYDPSHLDVNLRVPSSVQLFNRERGLHPTQKPVALFEYLIKTYTNPGDVVLDNCIGSGTTAIAAENTGRRWIGIERDAGYFGAACERIARAVSA